MCKCDIINHIKKGKKMRPLEEIYAMIDLANDTDGNCSGMSYEEGVKNALEWVLCQVDEEPIEV